MMLYGIQEKTTLKMTKDLALAIQRTHAVLKMVSLQLTAKKRTGSYGGRAYSDPSTYEKDPYCLEHGKYERG